MSDRYIADRFLPDKAIDLIDEAAAKLKMEITSKPLHLDEIDRKVGNSICALLQCRQCLVRQVACSTHAANEVLHHATCYLTPSRHGASSHYSVLVHLPVAKAWCP